MREPPGQRYSVRDDMTQLQYKAEHYPWIRESLSVRGSLRVMMGQPRIKNEHSTFDVGNRTCYMLCSVAWEGHK